MALASGTRLGPYEILSALGAGGMGEVYRATDTNLKRQVAIKVLPASLAGDADRLARLQREAEVLAALNHPNIAAIYGLEKTADFTALVMELVEGEDLSQRIARGAIPIDEALPIAKQIAQALEAAHEQGIIHRDLKPANVKVRADGTVKVLDFGLAKALDPAAGSSPNMSQSPTITTPAMTQMGMILGTAAYMSPEQARGKTVDKRADIWAFGVVLFEMLTGRRAFEAEDVSLTLAEVMKSDPDWSRIRASVPLRVKQLLRVCLQKDPRQRIGDMQDVRLALDGAFERIGGSPDNGVPARARRRDYIWAAIVGVLVIVAGVQAWRMRSAPVARRTLRFDLPLPAFLESAPEISPDGTRLAYTATADSQRLLWVRSLDATVAQALAGTDNATRPFWSTDSQWLAFFAQGKLKKIPARGGPVQTVCNLSSGTTYHGTWNRDDVILFGPNDAGPVLRVPAAGGQPVPATQLDTSAGELRHGYPNFLPDGRHFLYLSTRSAGRNTYVGTLDSNERREVAGVLSESRFSPTGHLLFIKDSAFVAQPFDPDRLALSGNVVQISEESNSGPAGQYSVSANGDIVFSLPSSSNAVVSWFDRAGTEIKVVGSAGEYSAPMLSPDGKSLAFDRGAPSDVWVMDLERQLASPFTTHKANDYAAVWSPDGRTILFVSDRDGAPNLYERHYGTMGEDKLVLKVGSLTTTSMDWSTDGRYVIYGVNLDIWALPRFGDQQPFRVAATPAAEFQARLSPDSHWVAYVSNESGQFEVWVQSFPNPENKTQVSTMGGATPRWKPDGTELYYVDLRGTVITVPITLQNSKFDVTGGPTSLFHSRLVPLTAIDTRTRGSYDVARDGRILAVTSREVPPIKVILDWSPERR